MIKIKDSVNVICEDGEIMLENGDEIEMIEDLTIHSDDQIDKKPEPDVKEEYEIF